MHTDVQLVIFEKISFFLMCFSIYLIGRVSLHFFLIPHVVLVPKERNVMI